MPWECLIPVVARVDEIDQLEAGGPQMRIYFGELRLIPVNRREFHFAMNSDNFIK